MQLWTATILTLLGATGSFWLALGSLSKTEELKAMRERLVISSATYADPGQDLQLLFDGDPSTAVANINTPAAPLCAPDCRFRGQQEATPVWTYPVNRPFVQFRAGLTHFPGQPPQALRARQMLIHSGGDNDSSRARDIRLIFFRQQVVDHDREYRLADPPVFWKTLDWTLADRPGAQIIPLENVLDVAPPSRGFPHEVQSVWVRLEVLSAYRGAIHPERLRLAELELVWYHESD